MPVADQERVAYVPANKYSARWVAAAPTTDVALTNEQFASRVADYYGLPQPAMASLAGKRTQSSLPPATAGKAVNEYGHALRALSLPAWVDGGASGFMLVHELSLIHI